MIAASDTELTVSEEYVKAHRAVEQHPLEEPALTLERWFYPFGVPVHVRTNRMEVLALYEQMWGGFSKLFHAGPIECCVRVVDAGQQECPPEPVYAMQLPFITAVANGLHHSVSDLERGLVTITLSSESLLRHPLYVTYFLLPSPLNVLTARYLTPIHGATVGWKGVGLLLCGDSGAGKSTLAYACARSGWTYVSDDASYVVYAGSEMEVMGNCYSVRLRPSSAAMFPETRGLPETPRAAGKPSVELRTADNPSIVRSEHMPIHAMVFLNRDGTREPALKSYERESARQFLRKTVFGTEEMREKHNQRIEDLLQKPLYALHYSELNSAIKLLEAWAEESIYGLPSF